tara:strand:- start:558 stop:1214 length:657 start_codon:yes stop_codon:yes gene_type:complete
MTFSPTRHDLPAALVAADAPLSGDVMSRSVESIDYLWQVTTNCIDAAGTACPAPEGHTHDGRNDQSLTADSAAFIKWSCGFGSPVLRCDSSAVYVSHINHFGGWVAGPVAITTIRAMVHVPFDVALGKPNNTAINISVLIEKGTVLSAANAVTINATLGGATLIGNSAAAATGLEVVTVGPFAAGSLPTGGPNELVVTIATLLSADYARIWHASTVTA